MSGETLALTSRDRLLLSEVQRFGVMTRTQLVRLGLFSSKTRANERLRRLTAAGYLSVRPQPLVAGGPRFIYCPGPTLSEDGKSHSRVRDVSDLFVHHQLGLVDIRLAFEPHVTPTRWLSAKELAPHKLGFVPDGYVEYEHAGLTYAAFIEYDRGTETLGRIEAKARAYADLAFSGRFERAFSLKYFRALFVTDTPGRLTTLTCAVGRVTNRVLRLSTLPDLVAQGPLALIWRRPGSTTLESLTPQ